MHGVKQYITKKKKTVYNYWCMEMNNFQNSKDGNKERKRTTEQEEKLNTDTSVTSLNINGPDDSSKDIFYPNG